MDFSFTPEQEKLKQEFEAFCRKQIKEAPPGWTGNIYTDDGWEYHRATVNKLASKGWLCLPWPKEHGGQGHGPIEQTIFTEVTSYNRVPGVPTHFMTVASSIMEYGTPEQKAEWLPQIARGEIYWAEALSEPDAGSDLASLKTRAVEDGDNFVINGTKIWTSHGYRSNSVFILARTQPDPNLRHRGLTFFISKIGQGINFRPLLYMNRSHQWEETTFDNFRVPRRSVLGPVNQGWQVMMTGRNVARGNIGHAAAGKRDLDDLVQYCRERKELGKNPLVRQRLAEFAVGFDALIKFAYYIAWLQTKRPVTFEASAFGYYRAELVLRLANTAVDIMGLYGTLKEGSRWTPLYGKFQDMCQMAAGLTIAGGTTEIRKNTVAWLGLGLPRS